MPKKPFALSVKVVIRDVSGRCLLLKRSMSSKYNKGKWDFPGGKVDKGESFQDALLREVTEETGLNILLKRVVGSAESPMPKRMVAYLILEGEIESGELQLSSEHDDYKWATKAELRKMRKDINLQFQEFVKVYAASKLIVLIKRIFNICG